MRILYLSDDFPPSVVGGAGKVAESLALGMVKAGHTVAVICRVGEQAEERSEMYKGMMVHYVYSSYHVRWRHYRSLYNSQTVGKVDGIMAGFKPDIVHAHNVHFYLSYACLERARKYTRRIFLTVHDVMLFHYGKLLGGHGETSPWKQMNMAGLRYNPLRNRIIRKYLRSVTTIFAVSDALRDVLREHGFKNVVTIHNGINTDEWKEDRQQIEIFKKKFNILSKKVILFAGRITGMKGGNVLVNALPAIVQNVPDAVLVIAGKNDDYASALFAQIEKLHLGDHMKITGWLSGNELVAAYHSATVVTVPSQYLDPFPTVNLEAMACAKPVICTNKGGSPEAVVHGTTGIVFDATNYEELARDIADLLTDDVRARQMGAEGLRRVREVFSIEAQVKSVLEHYTQ